MYRLHVITLRQGSVREYAQRKRCGVEAAARSLRFEAFASALKKKSSQTLFLAHHCNDQLETVLMRFFQGAGLRGLSGMKEEQLMHVDGYTFVIVRPLIAVSSADVQEYCRVSAVRYNIDRTNKDRRYMRNALRHTIIPRIAKAFPGLSEAVGALAKQNNIQRDFVTSSTTKTLNWEIINGGWRIDKSCFVAAHRALQIESLYQLAQRNQRTKRIPYRFINEIVEKCAELNNGTIVVGHGVSVYVRSNFLYWSVGLAKSGTIRYHDVVDTSENWYQACRVTCFLQKNLIGAWYVFGVKTPLVVCGILQDSWFQMKLLDRQSCILRIKMRIDDNGKIIIAWVKKRKYTTHYEHTDKPTEVSVIIPEEVITYTN